MNTQDIISETALGDQHATAFIEALVEISNTWDNLIDGDVTVDDEEVNLMMWDALVTLPHNPFYRRHFDALAPLVSIAILNWRAANRMERDGTMREVSYILRSSFVDIFVMVALLCGGPVHAEYMVGVIRKHTHHEGLAGYKAALIAERNAREG